MTKPNFKIPWILTSLMVWTLTIGILAIIYIPCIDIGEPIRNLISFPLVCGALRVTIWLRFYFERIIKT